MVERDDPSLSSANRLIEARRDLAAVHRLAVRENFHEGTWNHISVLVPDCSDQILITPGDRHWGQVTASSLVIAGPDATLVDGPVDVEPIAYNIHYPIHRANPNAVCVMHVHSPYATALTLVEGGRLNELASQQAANFYGLCAYYDEYDGLVTEYELGQRLADAIGDKRVLFLKNHGVIVVGPSVAIAYTDLYTLERACYLQILAMSTGLPLSHMPDTVAQGLAKLEGGGEPAYFSKMRAVLDQSDPHYAA